jgi:hypothetical protein
VWCASIMGGSSAITSAILTSTSGCIGLVIRAYAFSLYRAQFYRNFAGLSFVALD